jgi:hypothetical protein
LAVGVTAVQGGSYDAGLWDHVKHSVEEERWEQVASAAVIYVEDKVRRGSGTPLDKQGRKLVGQTLFATALTAGGPLALGGQSSETEGWRSLGTGLVSALGNVDRHGIHVGDTGGAVQPTTWCLPARSSSTHKWPFVP